MRILVFGKQGQVAQSLIDQAARDPDVDLIAAGRPDLDLERPGEAAAVIQSIAPHLIVNAAAYTAVDQAEDEPDRAFRINRDAAGEIAEAAAKLSVPLIHLSTDYVFDGTATEPYDEQARTNPLNVYGQSKLAGEARVREAGGRHLIVRTSWVYSPVGRNFVKTMMALAETREAIDVVADQRGCPTSASDLAVALLDIRDRLPETGGVFHLAGEGVTSWYAFATQIMNERRLLGLKAATVSPIAGDMWPTKAVRPMDSALDSGAFFEAFGRRLPDWRRSLRDCVAQIVGAPRR